MAVIIDHRYVQKSKLFLLPLIELKKDEYIRPSGTYVASDRINPSDYKLIVPFDREESSEFNYYETNYILSSNGLVPEDYRETDKLRIYVFDLGAFKEDFDHFLAGEYTEFSKVAKGFINMYWGTKMRGQFYPHPKINAYLNPTLSTYEQVSIELGVTVNDLLRVGELLNPPDLERETFKEVLELNSSEIES